MANILTINVDGVFMIRSTYFLERLVNYNFRSANTYNHFFLILLRD